MDLIIALALCLEVTAAWAYWYHHLSSKEPTGIAHQLQLSSLKHSKIVQYLLSSSTSQSWMRVTWGTYLNLTKVRKAWSSVLLQLPQSHKFKRGLLLRHGINTSQIKIKYRGVRFSKDLCRWKRNKLKIRGRLRGNIHFPLRSLTSLRRSS